MNNTTHNIKIGPITINKSDICNFTTPNLGLSDEELIKIFRKNYKYKDEVKNLPTSATFFFFYCLEHAKNKKFYEEYVTNTFIEFYNSSIFCSVKFLTYFIDYLFKHTKKMLLRKCLFYADISIIIKIFNKKFITKNIDKIVDLYPSTKDWKIIDLTLHIVYKCHKHISLAYKFYSNCFKTYSWLNYIPDIHNINSNIIQDLSIKTNKNIIDIINSLSYVSSKSLAAYIILNCDHSIVNNNIWLDIISIIRYFNMDNFINKQHSCDKIPKYYTFDQLDNHDNRVSIWEKNVKTEESDIDLICYSYDINKKIDISFVNCIIEHFDLEAFNIILQYGYEICEKNLERILLVVLRSNFCNEAIEILEILLNNVKDTDYCIKNTLLYRYNNSIIIDFDEEEENEDRYYFVQVAHYLTNYVVVNYSYIFLLLINGLYLDKLELFNIPYDMRLFNLCAIANFYPKEYINKINVYKNKQLIINSTTRDNIYKLGYLYENPLESVKMYIKKNKLDVTGYVVHNFIRTRCRKNQEHKNIKFLNKVIPNLYTRYQTRVRLYNRFKKINFDDSLVPFSLNYFEKVFN